MLNNVHDQLSTTAELMQAHRQQAEYFMALSHELRTPLNGVLGYLDLLADGHYGRLSSSQSEAIRNANDSAQGLLKIIESLLEFSKVSQNKLRPAAAKFDGKEVFALLQKRLEPLTLSKKISLMVEAESLDIFSDKAILEHILTNFIGNAIKFTPAGGKIVLVCRELSADLIEFGVSDTGPGVPVADRTRIFEPFVQLVSQSTRTHGGTGLGLALCRWYTSALQGVVGVDENTGGGAYFFVAIPKKLFLAETSIPIERFQERIRLAAALSARVSNQFSVVELSPETAGELEVHAELRRSIRASDLVSIKDGNVYAALFGAERLAAHLVAERLKSRFLYNHRLNIRAKVIPLETWL